MIECVPNFSEGRDRGKIDRIVSAIQDKPVKLLGVEPDADYNRTVVTFAGEGAPVLEAAFAAIKTASELIDMSTHKGQHPRMGSTDVCPFVPISATMQECVRLANELGKKVGAELHLPVYLYGEAAKTEDRRNLAAVRKGEYEGLAARLKTADGRPDYGPAEFKPKTGAVIIGARPVLIAYNVNLNTNDLSVANEISKRVRESGRIVNGERIPGLLKSVKALGVILADLDIAQVTMNLTDYHTTGLFEAFQAVSQVAGEMGYKAAGSEIVGLVPEEALLLTAARTNSSAKLSAMDNQEKLEAAINFLGLRSLGEFDPDRKVLEYILREQ